MSVISVTHLVLTGLLVLLVATFFWRWRSWREAVPDFDRRDLLMLRLTLAVAAGLRVILSHPTIIHTNFHGLRYLETALAGAVSDPAELPARAKYGLGNYTFFTFLWVFLPRTVDVYFGVNLLLSSLLAPFLYLFVRLLEGGRRWALFSALILAFLPAHIKVSATENDILLCSFFAMVSLVNWLGWLRTGRVVLLLGAAAGLALAVHTRILSSALPVALVLLVPFVPEWRARFRKPAAWAILAGTSLLLVPHCIHVWNLLHAQHSAAARSLDLLGLPFRLFSPAHNLLLDPGVTMPLLPVLVAAGVVVVGARRFRSGLAATLLMLFFGALYLYFSEHLLDCLRYQFFVWPFYALLAAIPFEMFPVHAARGRIHKAMPMMGAALLLTALLLPYVPWLTTPHVITREFDFIREGLDEVPAGSAVRTTGSGFDVAKGRVPSFTLPAFLLDEHGLVQADEKSEVRATVLYVGLQDYVFTVSEDPEPHAPTYRRPRAWPPETAQLVPIVTSTLRPAGDSPGPGLYFPAKEVTIGFYRVIPESLSQ